jgi:hypothetical protein
MDKRFILPKNKIRSNFLKSLSKLLPTIEYFVCRDQIKMARQSGWTITERYFQSFFCGYRNVFSHAYEQGINPWGYLKRQTSDAFIRRMETLIPGV